MIEIGSKVSGRYKITGNLGSGGMANVFLAHDLILDRDVAVKVLRFDFQDDKSAIRRFQREALAASELVHPNIVGVYDVGEEDGMQYLVMEYVRGTDLKKHIVNNFPIPLENVVIMMRQILSGISLAHQHRIIHRDLKPQNILMDEDGNVKIADFGIAIALSETSLTQTNTLLGSVHYLSPEQARGSMATRQSDIYALGIILYELLTGSVPFEGESAVSIALKHFQTEVPSVREVNSAIPQALENVVLHATAKEATDRYVSADDMAQDIGTSLSPNRINEPAFKPQIMFDETKVLTPLTEQDMPPAFKEMAPAPVEEEEYVPDLEEPPKKKKKKKKWFFLVALLLLVAGGATFLAFYRPDIKIPDISGKTVSEARKVLLEANLTVADEVIKVPDEKIEEGAVVKTDPPIGTRVKKKTEVTIYTSLGSGSIEMPDFEGVSFTDAYRILIDNGFSDNQIIETRKENDEIEKGIIISQKPRANKKVDPKKDKIELIVSKGRGGFTLDSLVGYSRAEAKNYLESQKLGYAEAIEYSDAVAEGLVIYHSPGAGEEVTEGATVTVTISLGRKPVETTPPSSSSEPKDPPPSSSEEPPVSSSESKDEESGTADENK